jgi:hypothetical protein
VAENIRGEQRPRASADWGETCVDYTPRRSTKLPRVLSLLLHVDSTSSRFECRRPRRGQNPQRGRRGYGESENN